MNAFDPEAEQPSYKKALLTALAGGGDASAPETAATAPKIGGAEIAPVATPAINPSDLKSGSAAFKDVDLSNRDAVKNYVEGYYGSKHVNPYDTSVDYWTNKIMGAKDRGEDPAYYGVERLGQADEFTGKGPHYDWQAAQGGGATPAPSAGFGGVPVAGALSGDPLANIQAALGKYSQAQSPDYLQQLLAKLQGGA